MSRSAISFVVGARGGPRASVAVIARAYPGGLGVFDGDWLYAQVAVHGAASPWRYESYLRAGDLAAFAGALAGLLAGQRDQSELWPRDPWIAFTVARGKDAAFRATLFLHENDSPRQATFASSPTAADLRATLVELTAVVARFPPRAAVPGREAAG